MSKRLSEIPQVPNLHPSSRVEYGTNVGVEVFKSMGRVIMVHLPLQIPIVFYLHPMQLKVLWNQ
eukprot:13904011-Ditylum_brightwellii.AAC.1